jgi:hypothetical protein
MAENLMLVSELNFKIVEYFGLFHEVISLMNSLNRHLQGMCYYQWMPILEIIELN